MASRELDDKRVDCYSMISMPPATYNVYIDVYIVFVCGTYDVGGAFLICSNVLSLVSSKVLGLLTLPTPISASGSPW